MMSETIEYKLRGMLAKRGLSDSETDTIMEAFKAQPYNDVVKGRWDDSVEDYPVEFLNGLTVGLFSEALTWIDANKPLAWYRPMFDLQVNG